MNPDYDPLDLERQHQTREKSEQQREREIKQQADDFVELMKSAAGRRFVWRLLEVCGVYRSTFRTVAAEAAFMEGLRNVGLMLVADIHAHCPERYVQMLNEAKEHSNE